MTKTTFISRMKLFVKVLARLDKVLEEADKGLISIALEEYKAQKYFESLSTFEKYLKENEIADGPDKANTYYVIGHCAYAIQNFEKALDYFSKARF